MIRIGESRRQNHEVVGILMCIIIFISICAAEEWILRLEGSRSTQRKLSVLSPIQSGSGSIKLRKYLGP